MKGKKWTAKVRRIFSLNQCRCQLNDKSYIVDGSLINTNDYIGRDDTAAATREKKNTALTWSPEDILNGIHGSPIDDKMRGIILLLEMGGGQDDKGWILDFSGVDDENNVIIARYDIPDSRVKGKKTPRGPPSGTYGSQSLDLKSFPWVWYKDRKIFSKIESGKLSDMVAFVTGKLAATGDPAKWEGIDDTWKEAKERAKQRKKLEVSIDGGGAERNHYNHDHYDHDDVNASDNGDADEEDEEIDEEARIIATYRPLRPLRDPTKKEFWKRHLGTDFLVASYLFLVSTIAFNIYAIQHLLVVGLNAHSLANASMATFFTFASLYFVKLSYPETIMLMAYHVMTIDPESMTFIERYFIANEFLIALWLFTCGFVLPYVFVIIWEVLVSHEFRQAFIDLIITIFSIPLTAVLNFSAMPDSMRANDGRGSSVFFDHVWIPLLKLKNDEPRLTFWKKHLGNDGLAGGWIFAMIGIISGVAVLPMVIFNPTNGHDWFLFWSTIPFTIGSLLLVRATYPENTNTSLFFKDEEEEEGEHGSCKENGKDEIVNGETTPLV